MTGAGTTTPLKVAAFATATAPELTAHGFWSSFRDWRPSAPAFPRKWAEQALAHTVSGSSRPLRLLDGTFLLSRSKWLNFQES